MVSTVHLSSFYQTPVKFREEDHTYWVGHIQLSSVGSVVKRYSGAFDAAVAAMRVAEREGLPVEEILERWVESGRMASEKGHRIHEYIKRRLAGDAPEADLPETRAWDQWWESASKTLEPICVECILHDLPAKIAGTVDLLAYSTKTGKCHVFDWKSNKRFDVSARFKPFRLRPPFHRLPDCHLGRYSLQLGFYRRMAEKIQSVSGVELGASYVIHLSPDGVATPHRAFDVHDEISKLIP